MLAAATQGSRRSARQQTEFFSRNQLAGFVAVDIDEDGQDLLSEGRSGKRYLPRRALQLIREVKLIEIEDISVIVKIQHQHRKRFEASDEFRSVGASGTSERSNPKHRVMTRCIF